jgi:hypothetical protein
MIDFVQGAGRGGRTQRLTYVFIVANDDHRLSEDHDEARFKCYKEMNQWLDNHTLCRRHHLSQCMDGQVATCGTLKDVVRYNVCDHWSISANLGRHQLNKAVEAHNTKVQELTNKQGSGKSP